MAVYINKNILRFLFFIFFSFFPCLLWNEIIISIKTNISINVTFIIIIIIIHIRNHLVKMRLFALPSQQLSIHLKLFYFILFRHIILYHWFSRFWCIQVAPPRFWCRVENDAIIFQVVLLSLVVGVSLSSNFLILIENQSISYESLSIRDHFNSYTIFIYEKKFQILIK